MDDFALALTNTMRTILNHTVPGDTIGTQAFIHARWPYVIVPTLMVVLSIGFVGVKIRQTNRRGLSLRKSNLVATVVHVGTCIKHKRETESAGHLDQASEVEEWARGMNFWHRSTSGR